MFSNARLFVQDVPLTRFASGTNLDPQCDWLVGADDDLLSDRVIADWGALKEPFLAVVHYSNIHHPRLYDPENAPFQPYDPHARAKSPAFRNYYKNVVYLSDLAVAKLLHHVRSVESGARTVVIYTSDHGEAFMEHGNENYHSPTVYDEEIRVPAWIDAPRGTLSPEEERSIRRARTEYLFQIDVPPTMLDLMGVWDDPAIAALRARMIGHPITRPERTTGPVPLTNVSWVWEYYLPNWGMMQGPLKVLAGPNDHAYQCFNLQSDPFEKDDLGEEACAPLVARARAHYHMMPADMRHLAGSPGWAAR
jgi:arylsulfatase A-like enzyme